MTPNFQRSLEFTNLTSVQNLGAFHPWEHIFSSFWRLLAPAPSAKRNVTTPNFGGRANFGVYACVPNFSRIGPVVKKIIFYADIGRGTRDARCATRDERRGTSDEGRGTTEIFITTRQHNFFQPRPIFLIFSHNVYLIDI